MGGTHQSTRGEPVVDRDEHLHPGVGLDRVPLAVRRRAARVACSGLRPKHLGTDVCKGWKAPHQEVAGCDRQRHGTRSQSHLHPIQFRFCARLRGRLLPILCPRKRAPRRLSQLHSRLHSRSRLPEKEAALHRKRHRRPDVSPEPRNRLQTWPCLGKAHTSGNPELCDRRSRGRNCDPEGRRRRDHPAFRAYSKLFDQAFASHAACPLHRGRKASFTPPSGPSLLLS